MFRLKILVVIAATILSAASSHAAAVSFAENFSTNPFSPSGSWSFGFGGANPSTNRFVWDSSAPAAYAGDPVGALKVHLDSSLPTVRLQRPLGMTLTDTNDFTLIARFSFTITSAPDDTAAQIAFGLVNSSLTGGDRSGTPDNFGSDDAFHTVEFNYFPSISTFFQSGPTLTPAVFGAQIASNADGFANFASIFGPASDLGDNTHGINALPQSVTLQVVLTYAAANKTLALTMSRVNLDGTLTVLDTELTPLSLAATGYNTNFPFVVNALAIMAYRDGFTTTNNPSLVADLAFQKFSFVASVLDPNAASVQIAGTNVVLTFPTTSNCLYDVQSRTDLATGSWSTIASNIVGTGGIVTNVDPGAATAPRRFYRVGLVLP